MSIFHWLAYKVVNNLSLFIIPQNLELFIYQLAFEDLNHKVNEQHFLIVYFLYHI